MYKMTLLFLLLFLMACSKQKSPSVTDSITLTIDLNKDSDVKRIDDFVQRIEIRLISLETIDNSIMNSLRPFVCDEGIFTYDYDQQSIFHFDLNGKYVNTIQRYGQGAEEYNTIRDWTVRDECLYVLDRQSIQIYDLKGKYIKRIPVEPDAHSLLIAEDGKYVTSGSINELYPLKIYDETGKIAEYSPDTPHLKDIVNYARSSSYTLGWHNEEIYFCQYYDHTIYHLEGDAVKPLYKLDLKADQIPEEMFEGSPDQKSTKLENNKTNMVVGVKNLTITDDWIIFNPEKWAKTKIVYYNKEEDYYIINNSLPYPYSTLFGEYKPPAGCINGEYYFLIQASELKDLLEELKAKDELKNYDFLKNIDPDTIDEEDNAWVVFYSLQ